MANAWLFEASLLISADHQQKEGRTIVGNPRRRLLLSRHFPAAPRRCLLRV